jgi:hypothetical protein
LALRRAGSFGFLDLLLVFEFLEEVEVADGLNVDTVEVNE